MQYVIDMLSKSKQIGVDNVEGASMPISIRIDATCDFGCSGSSLLPSGGRHRESDRAIRKEPVDIKHQTMVIHATAKVPLPAGSLREKMNKRTHFAVIARHQMDWPEFHIWRCISRVVPFRANHYI
jgi:hypothetical protein